MITTILVYNMHTRTYVYYRFASHVYTIVNTYCFLKAVDDGPATWVDQRN